MFDAQGTYACGRRGLFGGASSPEPAPAAVESFTDEQLAKMGVKNPDLARAAAAEAGARQKRDAALARLRSAERGVAQAGPQAKEAAGRRVQASQRAVGAAETRYRDAAKRTRQARE